MKITIYGKKIKLTEDLKEYVLKKIGGLDKYLDNTIESWVELDEDLSQRSGKKYRAEVQIKLPRRSLRAVETTTDIHAAIDLVLPKLKKEIEKYKSWRNEAKHKRGVKGLRE